MGHYPIKCIHCMRTIKADSRCVKISRGDIIQDISSPDNAQDDIFTLGDAISSMTQSSFDDYKSISDLRKSGNIESEDYFDTVISQEYKSVSDTEGKMTQKLKIKVENLDGKEIQGTVYSFFCPYCHSQLIGQAGKKPMYLISMLGPSSAGKTVYITMLHLMVNGRDYRLPNGYLHFEAIGSTAVEFHKYAETLTKEGSLPGTTAEDRKDPYLLEISYIPDEASGKVGKSCILGITDMRGEMLNSQRNDDLMKYNLPQFEEADGFIMMVDPEILEGFYKKIPEDYMNRDYNTLSLALTAMRSTINDCIIANIGAIDRPNVVALTKMDLLLKYRQMLNIEASEQVLAPKFGKVMTENLYRTYFLPMSRSTRKCIEYLSQSFSSYLKLVFSRTSYYCSISALGYKVNIDGQTVDNPRNLYPIRIEDPIIHLLMDLNFIPPFHRDIFYQFRDDCMDIWKKDYSELI